MRVWPAVLALWALSSCTDRSTSGLGPPKEGDPMTPNATDARPLVPPLDRALPANLETATFALG